MFNFLNPGLGEYFGGIIDNVFLYSEVPSQTQLEYIAAHGAAAIVPPSAPVPPTVLLLVSGFMGLAGWRRVRKN